MVKILTEGLRHLDMENQVVPYVGIDEYSSSVGQDDDLITLNFVVKGKAVAEDLSEWFERGYEWVVDAAPSPGEVTNGKWLVFVEMTRRSKSAEQIMEMISDLETLTGIKPLEWKMKIGEDKQDASVEFIKRNLTLSPHEYRVSQEEPLNEWREIAGIQTVNTYEDDEAMRALKHRAGIY
jgi:hypothetical protein